MVKRFGCEIELPFPHEVYVKGCTGDSNQGTFGSGDPVEDVEPMQVTAKRSTYGDHDIHEMVEVNEPNTHFPWSAVAYISNGCTGTFVGPRHVLRYFNRGVQSIYATDQININLLKELIINLDTMRTYLLSSL